MTEYIHPLFSRRWQVVIAGAVASCHHCLDEAKIAADALSVRRHAVVSVCLTKGGGDPVYTVGGVGTIPPCGDCRYGGRSAAKLPSEDSALKR